MKKSIFIVIAALFFSSLTFAQIRPTDQTGINVFEGDKVLDTEFNGLKVDIGGAFTQGYQTLNHSNTAAPKLVGLPAVDQNKLVSLVPGFNLASANLIFNTHLADGIILNMELYLSSRHHNETWVKGGYIQFDKLPFIHVDLLDNIMKFTTIKVGQMEVNYGDAHFRRSDNGKSIYNPFIENNIMDEFATEIAAEADFHYKGFIGVASITDGQLNSNIVETAPVANATDGVHKPVFIGKIGYDKQLSQDLRVRLTGSVYSTAGSLNSTLFGGDRTGSHYFGVMDYLSPSTSNAFSGRYNPGMTDKLTTFMGNLFVKFHGLEWFSTLESATGRAKAEITGDRNATQLATDLVYRFGKNENFWLGARYNTMTAGTTVASALTPVAGGNVTINREAISAGWFMTKNVMTKLEYVNQDYNNFASNSILNGGNFKGFLLEAVVGF